MRRREVKAKTITQSNDASSTGNNRGMARRAKRTSGKKLRQAVAKDTDAQIRDTRTPELASIVDPLKPDLQLLIKLGSIAVHAEEFLSSNRHEVDIAAMQTLFSDPAVQAWITEMT